MKEISIPGETTLQLEQVKSGLPGFTFPSSRQPDIRKRLKELNAVIVVLDDDPTGTQTVHGIPVYLDWTADLLEQEMRAGCGLFFLLTNSRALPERDAAALGYETGKLLQQAASATGKRVLLVSRSDSTLRGHYPAEVNALADGFGIPEAAHMLVPFFAEGGRFTYQDIHYVLEGETLVPAAMTPFASDATFGFNHSYLPDWIREKCGKTIRLSQIASISLEESRSGEMDRMTERLMPPDKRCFILNAMVEKDLETPVLAALEATAAGRPFIFRSASSLVRVLAGMENPGLLPADTLKNAGGRGGLVVVGSYVPKTTSQMEHALTTLEVVPLELEVPRLLTGDNPDACAGRLADQINTALKQDQTVLLFTSRELIRTADRDESLRLNMKVSQALVNTIEGLREQPRFLIAKGGITSCEIARQALKVRQAQVLGQILPGIPAWKLGPESRFPGLKYIVFPGNVGDADSLANAIQKLS